MANSATLSQPIVDDPRNLSAITYSDNQFRHKVVLYGTAPTFYGINIGVRYTGLGGTRFNLLSGGNTNGDFVTSNNDLAFIFDYTNNYTPEHIRKGIQAILDNPDASQSLKDVLRQYSGSVAQKNSGVNDFYGTIDLRISKNVKFYKTNTLEVSAEIFNFMNMLNKEWGVNKSLGAQTLYRVTGFNNTTQQFNYQVNNAGIATPSGNPFQVQLGVRYSF